VNKPKNPKPKTQLPKSPKTLSSHPNSIKTMCNVVTLRTFTPPHLISSIHSTAFFDENQSQPHPTPLHLFHDETTGSASAGVSITLYPHPSLICHFPTTCLLDPEISEHYWPPCRQDRAIHRYLLYFGKCWHWGFPLVSHPSRKCKSVCPSWRLLCWWNYSVCSEGFPSKLHLPWWDGGCRQCSFHVLINNTPRLD